MVCNDITVTIGANLQEMKWDGNDATYDIQTDTLTIRNAITELYDIQTDRILTEDMILVRQGECCNMYRWSNWL